MRRGRDCNWWCAESERKFKNSREQIQRRGQGGVFVETRFDLDVPEAVLLLR